jgi:hypothetical protein
MPTLINPKKAVTVSIITNILVPAASKTTSAAAQSKGFHARSEFAYD